MEYSISASKTKCLTSSKTPWRCQLVVEDKIIQQELEFKISRYRTIRIWRYRHSGETTEALRVAGCLNDTVWKNKHIDIDKTVIKPIIIYTAETRPDTTKTKMLLETSVMKVFINYWERLLDRQLSDNNSDFEQKVWMRWVHK